MRVYAVQQKPIRIINAYEQLIVPNELKQQSAHSLIRIHTDCYIADLILYGKTKGRIYCQRTLNIICDDGMVKQAIQIMRPCPNHCITSGVFGAVCSKVTQLICIVVANKAKQC